MKILKIVILAIILIPIIVIAVIYGNVKLKNSIFYDHPTYLPVTVTSGPIGMAGPGDLNPIIDGLWYQYVCTSGKNLSIRQVRKGAERGYIPEGNGLKRGAETDTFFGTYNGRSNTTEDF